MKEKMNSLKDHHKKKTIYTKAPSSMVPIS